MNKAELQKIIKEKVIGKVVSAHDETGHHYKIVETGQIVDSVTTKIILDKPHLVTWGARISAEYVLDRLDMLQEGIIDKQQLIKDASLAHSNLKSEAGDIGTRAHDIIEQYLNVWIKENKRPNDIRDFAKPTDDMRVFASIRSAEKMFIEKNVDPVATELLVASKKHGIAGTMDFLAFFDGKLLVSDWKTSNYVHDDYAIQVSAYKACFEEMTGIKVKGVNLVHLNKGKDEFKIYDIPNPNKAFATYKHIAKVYDWKTSGNKKLVESKKTKKI